jgi:hypothetical protein
VDAGIGHSSGGGVEKVGMEKFQRYDVLKDLLIAEDRVFGDRMNIFLVVNSIMLVAYGQFKLPAFVLPLLGAFLDLIWLYVGSLTLSAHRFWSDEMEAMEREFFGKNADTEGILSKRRIFYPRLARIAKTSSTESLAYILPTVFLAMWVYLLVK